MSMFRSLFGGGNLEKVNKEDRKITEELNTLQDKDIRMKGVEIETEIENDFEKTKEEAEQSREIAFYLDSYMKEHNEKEASIQTPLNEFVEFINNDENEFDAQIRDLIMLWVEKYKDMINFGNPVFFFLEFVKMKGREADHLLNPDSQV